MHAIEKYIERRERERREREREREKVGFSPIGEREEEGVLTKLIRNFSHFLQELS